MSLLTTAGGGANGASEFVVTNSARFDRASADRLYFDQGSGDDATARRKWTFSTWIKRGQLVNTSNHQYFFGVGSYTLIGFRLDGSGEADDLYVQVGTGSSAQGVHTNAKFKDTAAWMNIYVAFDSTDGTAANRLKVYINGNLVDSAYGDYSADQRSSITQNNEDDFVGNSGDTINIAYSTNGTDSYFDGYMADTHLLIGTTKDYTDFGESNSDGVWVPKETSFSTSDYGSNGFKLEYKQTGTSANSSGIGADTSGNDNHFTVQNLNAQNVTEDVPTNNFCTVNPIGGATSSSKWTFSEGNTQIQQNDNGNWRATGSTMAVSKGKWYWEIEFDAGTMTEIFVGVHDSEVSLEGTNRWVNGSTLFYNHTGGEVRQDGTNTSNDYGVLTAGDILGVALNMDDNQISFYDNGSAIISNFSLSSYITGFAMPTFLADSDDVVYKVNFGNPAFSISSGNSDANGYGNFEYAVPSGYYSLCTKNLAQYG